MEQLIASLGGKVEAYYFAFGDYDFVLIADLPGNVRPAAGSLAASSAGGVTVRTTVLLTPEEMDAATKQSTSYRLARRLTLGLLRLAHTTHRHSSVTGLVVRRRSAAGAQSASF